MQVKVKSSKFNSKSIKLSFLNSKSQVQIQICKKPDCSPTCVQVQNCAVSVWKIRTCATQTAETLLAVLASVVDCALMLRS